ncbi:MAG: hypothetical protein Q8Q09_13815 [Deltaproteobacteria bacterium]|nr:hypothetical protein [Deltaproteobacteria bacterium]
MSLYLGIEIGQEQLRVVCLRAQYRKLEIEAIYRVVREPTVEGLLVAAQSVRAVLPQAPDGVFVAIGGTDVSMQPMSLPRALLRRGSKIFAAELEGRLPFEVESAVIDATVVRDGEVNDLLACAAPIDMLAPVIAALKSAGLEPREVGVMPMALGELSTAFVEMSSPDPVLLVHAYESRADVCVIANGRVQFARTLTGQNTDKIRDRAVRLTLASYLGTGGASVVSAYVFGDEGHLFAEAVCLATGLDATGVRMYPPQGSFTLGPNVIAEEVRLVPTALALAMRGVSKSPRIDLRKGSLVLTGNAQILRERAPLLIVLTAAIALTWVGATAARYYAIRSDRDRLTAALALVTSDVFEERITDPQTAIARARGANETIQDPLPPADAFDVVGVISTRIPEGTRNHDIMQLEVNDEHVQIQGIAATVQDRDSIVEALKQYECFPTVTPGRTQRNPGDERHQYTLDVDFRCPGRQVRRGGRAGAGGTTAGSTGTTGTTTSASQGGSNGSN